MHYDKQFAEICRRCTKAGLQFVILENGEIYFRRKPEGHGG